MCCFAQFFFARKRLLRVARRRLLFRTFFCLQNLSLSLSSVAPLPLQISCVTSSNLLLLHLRQERVFCLVPGTQLSARCYVLMSFLESFFFITRNQNDRQEISSHDPAFFFKTLNRSSDCLFVRLELIVSAVLELSAFEIFSPAHLLLTLLYCTFANRRHISSDPYRYTISPFYTLSRGR